MITYVSGNIFSSPAQCLINPVNCVGVMGKGLALEFKRQFPQMYLMYRTMCAKDVLHVGQVAFYKNSDESDKIICLFPTKDDWRRPSRVEYVDKSLQAFVKLAPEFNITSVAFPKVGCGEGGLHFERHVRPLLELRLQNTKFEVEVYV